MCSYISLILCFSTLTRSAIIRNSYCENSPDNRKSRGPNKRYVFPESSELGVSNDAFVSFKCEKVNEVSLIEEVKKEMDIQA